MEEGGTTGGLGLLWLGRREGREVARELEIFHEGTEFRKEARILTPVEQVGDRELEQLIERKLEGKSHQKAVTNGSNFDFFPPNLLLSLCFWEKRSALYYSRAKICSTS